MNSGPGLVANSVGVEVSGVRTVTANFDRPAVVDSPVWSSEIVVCRLDVGSTGVDACDV